MKKYFLFLVVFSSLASCQSDSVEKPDNLIPEDKMIDIIYDLSILQAMRNSNQSVLDSNSINPNTYIYKKYKIDSLQFAKSNQYYAAKSIKEYDQLYQSVNDRIVKNKAAVDTLLAKQKRNDKKLIKSDTLKVQ
ncbi:DUF4296 domain-containing protein [Flavobacterium qiangtangense]|uniref:DUF4296 domain-containing protein n=1 Tax=Flavobacterium qiangtangense TaxID=1442595 RepID=A0ABW1PRZ3_9FLAO